MINLEKAIWSFRELTQIDLKYKPLNPMASKWQSVFKFDIWCDRTQFWILSFSKKYDIYYLFNWHFKVQSDEINVAWRWKVPKNLILFVIKSQFSPDWALFYSELVPSTSTCSVTRKNCQMSIKVAQKRFQ